MSLKKQKNKASNNDNEKIQELRQAYLKEAEGYKQKVRPLVQFLRKKKLKFQHANVGSERVQYFRIDQFQKIVEENKEYIDGQPTLKDLIDKFYKDFIFFKRPNNIKIKYPKNLQPVGPENVQKKYASFRFDTTQSKNGITIFIILCVLALVMFPIWPYEVKYAIWFVCLILLIFLVGLIIFRLVIYLLIVIFNYHVWIFPNLLSSNGFLDSFLPVIEVSKGDKSWLGTFIRLFAISSFLLFILHVYINPGFLDDNISFTKETINDIHDWGVNKLKNQGNFSQRAITNLDQILNKTADVLEEQDDADKIWENVENIEQDSQNYSAYVEPQLEKPQEKEQIEQQVNQGTNDKQPEQL